MKLPLSAREDMLCDDPEVSDSMTAFCSTLLKLVKLKEACSPLQGPRSGLDTPFDKGEMRFFDESFTEDDSFLSDPEHDQATEDYPKKSVQFIDPEEDDPYSCDFAEYYDEVSEPLIY